MNKTHKRYVDQIEQIVREIGRPYVAVDDARKAIFSGAQIDSFDLLVYMPDGDHLLATVLPPSRRRPTQQQESALRQWERVFAAGFAAAFIRVGQSSDQPTAWRLASTPRPSGRSPRRRLACPSQPASPAGTAWDVSHERWCTQFLGQGKVSIEPRRSNVHAPRLPILRSMRPNGGARQRMERRRKAVALGEQGRGPAPEVDGREVLPRTPGKT